ncbi:TIGR02301 family protein [Hoeflea marina]
MVRTARQFAAAACVLTFSLLAPGSVAAQSADEAEAPAAVVEPRVPPPYDARLLRLAEIIGSIDYLRNLCRNGGETEWRASMQALLDGETADEPDRHAKLTAGFNRGYRTFASVYTTCTAAAVAADERYRREGATLAAEIVARYGN